MERALGELVREQAPRGAVAIGSLVAGQFRSATERIAREAELPGKGCYLVVGVSLGPAKPVHARLDVSGESLEEAACTRVDGSRRARLVLGLTGGRGVAAAQIFRVR